MHTVTFLPGYRKIEVPRETTVLDAAQRAGLNINVVCGGQGKCGKCVVYVQSGKTESVSYTHLTLPTNREV